MATSRSASDNAARATSRTASAAASDTPDQSRVDSPSPDAVKDPAEWTTGDESMTGAQASYLHTLAHEAGEEVDESLTKAEASQKIDELRAQTGRGINH